MIEKKLLTLACAAGILACGACFLPTLPDRQPPPPPARLALAGIQSIWVSVTNTSESHRLDPRDLAQAVIKSINEQSHETGVSAYEQRDAADAVLEVTVVSETEKPLPSNNKGVVFEITISATLTRKEGDLMWRETEALDPFSYSLTSDYSGNPLQNASVRAWVTNMLSTRLVYRMLHGR
jgi:hypothetical protein